MKRVEEIIPSIIKELEEVVNLKNKKALVDTDLKKHIRSSRISLENIAKNVKNLRSSFLNTLGYFPEGSAEKLKEIQDKVLDAISDLREKESKYFSSPKETFEEIKHKVSEEVEDIMKRLKSL